MREAYLARHATSGFLARAKRFETHARPRSLRVARRQAQHLLEVRDRSGAIAHVLANLTAAVEARSVARVELDRTREIALGAARVALLDAREGAIDEQRGVGARVQSEAAGIVSERALVIAFLHAREGAA